MTNNKYNSVYYNNDRYYDSTAGQAIINIIREERRKNKSSFEQAEKAIAETKQRPKSTRERVIDPILQFTREFTANYNATHVRTSVKKKDKPFRMGTIKYVYTWIQLYHYCIKHCNDKDFAVQKVAELFAVSEKKVCQVFSGKGDISKVIRAWNQWNEEKKERDMWYKFYMTFNDDNIRHADNAFHNNGLSDATGAELHAANISWVKEILNHGVSSNVIIENLPEAEEYLKEALSNSI